MFLYIVYKNISCLFTFIIHQGSQHLHTLSHFRQIGGNRFNGRPDGRVVGLLARAGQRDHLSSGGIHGADLRVYALFVCIHLRFLPTFGGSVSSQFRQSCFFNQHIFGHPDGLLTIGNGSNKSPLRPGKLEFIGLFSLNIYLFIFGKLDIFESVIHKMN